MKTIKLDIQNKVDILDEMRIFNSIVRMSYNRFFDGFKEKTVRQEVSSYFNENCWFIQCAIKDAKSVYSMFKDKPVFFGGKYNLKRYLTGKIDKLQYKYNRMRPICIQGEQLHKGNRLFTFNFDKNTIIFKKNRTVHKEIVFKPLKKNLKNELTQLQELINSNKIAVTVKLTDKHIWITYDECLIHNEKYKGLKENRILGIDMNPNYIGLSVIEFNNNDKFKILHKQVFDLTQLTVSSGKASNNKKSKYLTNKLKHETIAIAHEIDKLVNVWKCKVVSIEDLSIKSKDQKKGKQLNKLCNNKWERNLFMNKLKMLANIHRYDIVEVNPAYSSIIGNIAYGNENTPDMVAASVEIARRAYKKFEKGWFYPKFNIQFLNEQWKQTLGSVENWKELFQQVKKSGLKYRFQLVDYVNNAVFSKNYIKSKWKLYIFI
jgi:predicted transposase